MAKKTTSTSRASAPRKSAAKPKAAATPEASPAAAATSTLVAPTPAPTKVIERSIPADIAVGADQATPTPKPPPSHQQIAERAYALYQAGMPGGPEAHWFAAERELTGR